MQDSVDVIYGEPCLFHDVGRGRGIIGFRVEDCPTDLGDLCIAHVHAVRFVVGEGILVVPSPIVTHTESWLWVGGRGKVIQLTPEPDLCYLDFFHETTLCGNLLGLFALGVRFRELGDNGFEVFHRLGLPDSRLRKHTDGEVVPRQIVARMSNCFSIGVVD